MRRQTADSRRQTVVGGRRSVVGGQLLAQLALVAEAAQGAPFGVAEAARWAMCGRTTAYQVVKFGLATGRLARAGRGRYICRDGSD